MTLVLSRSEIAGLLGPVAMADAIRAIEIAFTAADRSTDRFHVAYGPAALHVVAGGVGVSEPLSVKVNLRTPDPVTGRHQVRGVILVFDPAGSLAAVMDSTEITLIRTAILTAVAVERTGFAGAGEVLFVGSGNLTRYQAAFLRRVMSHLRRIRVWSREMTRSRTLAETLVGGGLHAEPVAVSDLRHAAHTSDVIITMTPAASPLIGPDDVGPGALVVALGADGPGKNEIDPRLLAASLVIVDDLAQCARSGELHHAIEAGLMTPADVFATLNDVLVGHRTLPGGDTRIVVDSTGTALQDQAVASLVVHLAQAGAVGREIDFLA